MKFPTYEEMAQNVAEKVLDEYEYKGKTLREWVEIISASEHSTNLASLGTDCISRQAAINALGELATFTEDWSCHTWMYTDDVYNAIEQLPPIQPKRGKWIDKGITGDWQYQIDGRGRSWHEWQCDQCKDMVKKRSFYCPNCGSRNEVTT